MNKNTEALKMVDDMEDVEKLLGMKGRFVGDMVHISIKDLAEISRKTLEAQPVEVVDIDGIRIYGRQDAVTTGWNNLVTHIATNYPQGIRIKL